MRRGRLPVVLLAGAAGAVLLFGGPGRSPGDPPDRPPAAAAAQPAAPHVTVPHVTVPHDRVATAPQDGTPAPGAAAAAERFVVTWSRPGPEWHRRVSQLATATLADALATSHAPGIETHQVEPAMVLLDTSQWARVAVPTVRGEVVLDLVLVDGDWLVTGLDWQPGRDSR